MTAACPDVLDFPTPLPIAADVLADGKGVARIDGRALDRSFTIVGPGSVVLGRGQHDGVLDWYVSDAAGVGVVFFRGGVGGRSRMTLADGREAELVTDVAQDWTLTDARTGALLVHARATWGLLSQDHPAWRVAQDGSLDLVTVVGIVAVRRRVEARKEQVVRGIGNAAF